MKHFCEASYFDNTQPSNTAQASIGVDIREVNTSDPPVVLRLHRKSGPDRAADPAAQPTEVRMYANKMYKAEKTGLPEHLLVNCTYGTLKHLERCDDQMGVQLCKD